ncbi:MAG: ribonuclease P protein component [Anaerolineales bacterium]|jgi:ribonuclease P protein component
MDRKYRLTSSIDFKRVRRTGKSYAHPLTILVTAPNGKEISRFGVTTGRTVGGSVVRNRTKRRMREALRKFLPQIEPGWDIILIARSPLAEAEWTNLCESIAGLLRRAGILGLSDDGKQ